VGTRQNIDVLSDPWISLVPLNRWPAFISMDITLEDLTVAQFVKEDRSWDVKSLSCIVNSDLLSLIVSIPLSSIMFQILWAGVE